MRVDVSKSKYHEDEDARKEFKKEELKVLRIVLRRLRFLEHHLRVRGGSDLTGDASAVFNELEVEGLVFILREIGFLETTDRKVPA